jgi:ABC-type thiamine transport system substrate-binding protein
VLPANSTAVVPEEFERWGTEIADALMLDPAEIEERRAEWTEEWVEIVLR